MIKMKKYLFGFLTFLLAFNFSATADHTYGGEIGWTCLPNGKYVFHMSFYRDCTGIQYPFQEETIEIVGSPLPTDGTGATVSTITMKPDSNRWRSENDGETAPECTGEYGISLSCANDDKGIIQRFFFKSDPIILAGTPPNVGWKFFWESTCCRPINITNISTNGVSTLLLRAFMYPTKGREDVDPCIDSSPEFRSLPVSAICRAYEFTYNATAIDRDLDSLTYAWDQAFSPPIEVPVAVTYKPGYNFSNPTPDKTFDTQNIPSTLNRISGLLKMRVNSGIGFQKFLTVMQVDAWRDGVIIASVFRELPLSVFDCPPLPSGFINNPPSILIEGEDADAVRIEAIAGQEVRVSIEVKDLDQTGVGSQLQTVTLVPDGLMFTQDRSEGSPCQIAETRGGVSLEPCAYLQKATPFLDQTAKPPVRKITGLGGVATEFVWQTDCPHVQTKTGQPGTRSGIYNFVMRVTDDHCPVPSINYPTITVRVKDPITLLEPIVKGISIGLDGLATYQWAPAIDSANTFEKYLVERATVNDGFTPTKYTDVNDNLRLYSSEKKYLTNFGVYRFLNNNPSLGPDLLKKVKNGLNDLDWYLRMTTVSGCEDTSRSEPSAPVRVIEVESTPGGVFPEPLRAGVTLNWNRPKPRDAKTHDYFKYESQTHFYIYENDSVDKNGIIDLDALADTNNWYLRGVTTDESYTMTGNVCGQYVAFRVEARDTVRTPIQGHGLKTSPDSIATLAFSSFSMIDTMFMVARGIIPKPEFDTIQVLANGDVYVRVDAANAGTIGEFQVFEDATTVGSPVANMTRGEEDSALIAGANANVAIRNYIMKAVDGCNPSVNRDGDLYNTILPTGNLVSRCPPRYRLSWNEPGGFPNGVRNYKIYANIVGEPTQQVGNITNASTTTIDIPLQGRGVTYEFQVIAEDEANSVNISAIHNYTTPTDLRTEEEVPAPPMFCTRVEQNGSVTITYSSPYLDERLDSTDNTLELEFSSRPVGGGNWTVFTGLVDPTTYRVNITGINAQQQQYEFRARTRSGCDETYWSPYSTISSIFLEVTPRAQDVKKQGDIVWNDDAVPSTPSDTIYRYATGVLADTNDIFFTYLTGSPQVDGENIDVCDETFDYHLKNNSASAYDVTGQLTCESKSNISTANYRDDIPPPPAHLDYISYNIFTDTLEAFWSNPNPGESVDSLEFHTLDGFNSGLQAYRELGVGAAWDDDPKMYRIHHSQLDYRDSCVAVGSLSKDACGFSSSIEDVLFHKSMDIEVRWNVCDTAMELTWNQYVGFDENFDVEYTIYWNNTGDVNDFNSLSFPALDTISDTTYVHKIPEVGKTYYYFVQAKSTDGSGYRSNSTIDQDLALLDSEPRFGYATYATVLPDESIELEYFKDTLVNINGYIIYRGTDRVNMNPIGFVGYDPIQSDLTFQYVDANVEVHEKNYYYNVVIQNDCDVSIDTSNVAGNILLNVHADNEGLRNILRWNEYGDWDSTVSFYNIYRGVDGPPTADVYAVVTPSQRRMNTFIDDVYDDVFSIGEFSYRVEAVQGPVSPSVSEGYPNSLSPAISTSNTVAVTQEPLFYVPNAFAPDGVNKVFGPKEWFSDFSLYEMVIYNRWGEEVYRTRDLNKGWDGTMNGEIVQMGSYVYMIRFVDADGDEHRRKGTVTLLK